MADEGSWSTRFGEALALGGTREYRFPELGEGITVVPPRRLPSIAATPSSGEANGSGRLWTSTWTFRRRRRRKAADSRSLALRSDDSYISSRHDAEPSAANGLQACSTSQIGYLGRGGSDPFAPGSKNAEEPMHFTTAEARARTPRRSGR